MLVDEEPGRRFTLLLTSREVAVLLVEPVDVLGRRELFTEEEPVPADVVGRRFTLLLTSREVAEFELLRR